MSGAADRSTTEHANSWGHAPNRRERRRAETRERLIRCALKLFSERGFFATTVEDITNAADVGKGTFFNYFPSKEHILASYAQSQMGKVQKSARNAIKSTKPTDMVLFDLASEITEDYGRCPKLLQNVLIAFFSSKATCQIMADAMDKALLALTEFMTAGQQRGEIRDDVEPTELALQFQRVFFGTLVLWSLAPSRPLAECLKEMSMALWSGIRARD